RLVFLCLFLPSFVRSAVFPSGAAKAECRNRVFSIWVDKNFIGSRQWHLEVLNKTGAPVVVSEGNASQCGYSITKDIYGNVEMRVSFLACWVLNMNDLQFDLNVRFILEVQAGVNIPFPIALSCRIVDPWNIREVLCEESFMEVSVRRIVPWVTDWTTNDTQTVWPVDTQGGLSPSWQVEFKMLDNSVLMVTAADAFRMGYGLNATATRVVFRAPYNTSESRIMKVGGYKLEVILAKMYYSQPLIQLIVDTTTACPYDPPVFTNTTVSWLTPTMVTPLVVDYTTYSDRGVSMGVDGNLLEPNVIAQNGYILNNNGTTVDVTVPIGAPGGYTESDILNNQYGSTYHIQLLLVHHWRGAVADTTRHSAIKPISTPFRPQTLIFINNTDPKTRLFNVSLGNFFPDVDLKSFVIKGVNVALEEAKIRGFQVAKVDNRNGTDAYVLQVPFSDPLVKQEHLHGSIRQYTLYVTYVMTLLTKNKNFTYTDVVVCQLEDVVLPSYNKTCGKDRFILNMTRGNMDLYWIPFIRNLPLSETLVKSQNYRIFQNGSFFYMEVPLFAVGLVYEDISLRGIQARLDFSLKDNKTLQVRSSYSFECNFPTGRLLVCLPNGTMKATVLGLDTQPPFDPRETHLKDPTCKPQEANKDRALFSFSVYTCGTTRQFDSDYLVYENEVTFDRKGLPPSRSVISRNSTYRLTLRCRYPIVDTEQLVGRYNRTIYGPRGLSTDFSSVEAKVIRKRTDNTKVSDLKVAKDDTFTSFYTAWDFPVLLQRDEDLYFQAHEENENPLRMEIQDCWATTSQQLMLPTWDLIVDGK
ncbi:hypothetical protein GDO86_018044, partial [Hymenochirus boettgeri]